ncbi:MAG: cell division protein FtsL [Spirochaetales bacterium]|nr:cell division protein FtsL [Spirochaetales bacterium]
MRLKRFALVLFVLFLLFFFYLNTWQGYRYERLKAQVAALEREQKDWLERNKRLIAGLAVLSSPSRVAELAETELGLRKLEPQERLKLRFGPWQELPR